jgi:hypothetical protein
LTLFNNNGGQKIRERDAHMRMKTKFVDKHEDSDYCFHLVLSESQIKSWISSETGCRKKTAVNRVIEKGFIKKFNGEVKNPANLFPETWRALSSHTQCRIGSVCCN